MIDFKKELAGYQTCFPKIKEEYLEIPFSVIEQLLLRQIDEDNKRFLGYVGEDERVFNEIFCKEIVTWDEIKKNGIRNELRAELRDKLANT